MKITSNLDFYTQIISQAYGYNKHYFRHENLTSRYPFLGFWKIYQYKRGSKLGKDEDIWSRKQEEHGWGKAPGGMV